MSILAHGLDVTFMRTTGIAGSITPEAQGTHLVDRLDEAWWYASFPQHERVDIWEIRAAGLHLEESQDGWLCRDAIPPGHLTLLECDVIPDEVHRRLHIPTDRGDLAGDLTVTIKDTTAGDDSLGRG